MSTASTTGNDWAPTNEGPGAAQREEIVALLKDEMRVPLTALQALRETVDRGDLSPELAGRMQRHTKALARRLALLLEDLVLVYTWGGRKVVLDMADLNLTDQINRVAEIFPDMLIYVEAAADVQVRADALRLQQLLANLIQSAQRGGGGRPVCLFVSSLDDKVTLRLLGAPPARGHELEIAAHLAEAHGGRLRRHASDGSVTVTLRRHALRLA